MELTAAAAMVAVHKNRDLDASASVYQYAQTYTPPELDGSLARIEKEAGEPPRELDGFGKWGPPVELPATRKSAATFRRER